MAQFAIISRQRKGRRQQHSLGRGFGLQLMNCRVIRSFRWAEPLPSQQAETKEQRLGDDSRPSYWLHFINHQRQKRKIPIQNNNKKEAYHPAAAVCPLANGRNDATHPSTSIYLFRRRKIITQAHLAPSTETNGSNPMNHRVDFHWISSRGAWNETKSNWNLLATTICHSPKKSFEILKQFNQFNEKNLQ